MTLISVQGRIFFRCSSFSPPSAALSFLGGSGCNHISNEGQQQQNLRIANQIDQHQIILLELNTLTALELVIRCHLGSRTRKIEI